MWFLRIHPVKQHHVAGPTGEGHGHAPQVPAQTNDRFLERAENTHGMQAQIISHQS